LTLHEAPKLCNNLTSLSFRLAGESREGRTKAAQARDFVGAGWVFGREGYKASLCVDQMEAACNTDNAYAFLLSSIKGKRQIKTEVVE
jgi:hypothetical protein